MRRLSVLFLNQVRPEEWGGVETWMRDAARGLAGHGHRVVACGRPDSLFLETLRRVGVATESLSLQRDFSLPDALKLRGIVRRFEVDVIVTKLNRGIRLARLARAMGGRAAVVQRQGLFEVREGLRHRIMRRWVDRVITPSHEVRQRIIESGAFPAERVDLVRNGVDAERFRPSPETRLAERERLGLPAGPLLVNTARLHDQKGHDLLLDALARLPEEVHLAVAGGGKLLPALEAQVARLGLEGRTHFLGRMPDPLGLLQAADAFVLSSRYEGMPNSVLEAMAVALPVVTTRVGDVPSMLEDGVTGLTVPPGDPAALAAAVTRVLYEPDLARRLGASARDSVREAWPLEPMVTGTEQSLLAAAEGRGTEGGRPPRGPSR